MFSSRILNLKNTLKYVAPILKRCLTSQQVPRAHGIPELNPWIYQQNVHIKTPPMVSNRLDLPNGLIWSQQPCILPFKIKDEMIVPSTESANTPKEAIRMIVIRRKKMKKHKLKKLRKRMKFEWAKQRQKREMKKEKEFQAVLIQQCKDAESFSAENYVTEKLNKLHEVVVPRYWKGKRLPEFLIRQKMGLPPK